MSYLQSLRDRGFDDSTVVPFRRAWIPRCSQCEALIINGTPCHEQGCPNDAAARREAASGERED
jgi:hypothetical protein